MIQSVFKFWEDWWPWIGALVVTLVWSECGAPFPHNTDALLGTAGTVASVLASFLGVSKAILLSIKTTDAYRALQKAKLTDKLFAFLRAGILASVVFLAVSILGFFIDHEKIWYEMRIHHLFRVLWVFCGASAFFTCIRVSNIMFKLLKVA